MKLTPDKLSRDLAAALRPVWLLSGDEPLLVGEAADAVREAARAQGFAEREVHFVERAAGAPWNDILSSAQSLSLFASRRVVEVRLPSGKPGTAGAKVLQQLAAAAGPDLLVLVITDALDRDARQSSWVQAFDAAGAWVDAPKVGAVALPGWLRARGSRLGVTLDDDAVAVLVARTEGNLLAADQELRKLQLAGVREAGADALLASATASSRFDVKDLGVAVLAGDAPRALHILASLRAEGGEPHLVLWAILQELRSAWLALLPGPPVGGVWSSDRGRVPQAADRLRGRGRAAFARLTERAARADRLVKGQLKGNAWDEIAMLIVDFAGRDALPLPRRSA